LMIDLGLKLKPSIIIPMSKITGFPELRKEGTNGDLQFKLFLHIMSGCESLYLLPPAIRRSLSDGNCTRH
ncbi:hypothetical protein STEG23_002078, partial [Scotinomys teguina]